MVIALLDTFIALLSGTVIFAVVFAQGGEASAGPGLVFVTLPALFESMPGGGFVMSFSDITAYRDAERALKDANEGLEQRVSERTHELSKLNKALTAAKSAAEAASQSKTRFLAAVSHDLKIGRAHV